MFVAVRAVILGREVLDVLGQHAPHDVDLEALPGVAEIPGRRRPLPAATAEAAPVTIPEDGTGSFDAAPGSTPAVGAGELVTYTVEVEAELSLPSTRMAQVVDQTFADPRSWTASNVHAVQRVPAAPDKRVLLATPGTTDRLCAPLDTGGRLSCRNGNLVVLDAWRWINGADAYAGNLAGYRRYLVNHEFGHALGNAHQYCTLPGLSASVMVQQTKGLRGCQGNPWPSL